MGASIQSIPPVVVPSAELVAVDIELEPVDGDVVSSAAVDAVASEGPLDAAVSGAVTVDSSGDPVDSFATNRTGVVQGRR